MNDITVTISGPTGSGKSAIWQVLAEALAKHGIVVNELDQLDTCGDPDIIAARLTHVRERGTVTIVECNTRK